MTRTLLLILSICILTSCYTKKAAIARFCQPGKVEQSDSNSRKITKETEIVITPKGFSSNQFPCPQNDPLKPDTVFRTITKTKHGACSYEVLYKNGLLQIDMLSDSIASLNQVVTDESKEWSIRTETFSVEVEVIPWWIKLLLWVLIPPAIVGAIRVIVFFKK